MPTGMPVPVAAYPSVSKAASCGRDVPAVDAGPWVKRSSSNDELCWLYSFRQLGIHLAAEPVPNERSGGGFGAVRQYFPF